MAEKQGFRKILIMSAAKDRNYSPDMITMGINALDSQWFRKKLIQTALFLATLVLVGHPLYAQEKLASPEKTLDKVSLQLTWYHEFQFAGYYAAQLKGFYAEEGLEVEIRDRRSNQLPADAVLSGDADFGTATSDIVLLRMQGKPVVALACIMQHSPWALLLRADSNITTLEDLIGKTISMDMNYRDVEILAMLRGERISTEKMTFVKKEPGVEDLISGRADARASYISDQPFALQEKGIKPRVIRPINYGIDFYGDTLFTSERQIREHPKRVAAFRRASLRGWQYAMEHPEELIEYILATYYAKPAPSAVSYSREHLRFEAKVMTEELMHPVLVEIGHMNPQRWRRIADTYAELGLAKPIDSLEGFIYNPNPQPDRRWIFVAAGLMVGVACVGVLAWIWSKHLQRAVTQRTKELHQSEEGYRVLVEGTENFVTRVDNEGKFIFVNQTSEKIFGLKPEECIGLIAFDFIHPDDRERTKEAFDGWLRDNIESSTIENRQVSRAGEIRDMLWTCTVVRDESGQVVGVDGIAQDITERKQAEEALKKSEERLSGFMQSATDGFILYDSKLNLIDLNEAAIQMSSSGTKREDFIEKNLADLIPDSKKPWIYDAYQNVLKTGKSLFIDDIDMGPDRGNEYRALRIFKVLDGVGVVCTDITERKWAEQDRKKAEDALRESEAKFRGLIESSSDWISEVNAESVYTYSSPQVEKILGYKPEEILGKTPFDLMLPGEAERVAGIFKECMETGQPLVSLENTNLHKDGRLVVLETSGVPVLDEAGKVLGYRGVDRDITDRKQAERSLRESEAKYRTFFENSSDAMLIIHDYKFVDCNAATVAMLGHTNKEDLLNTHPSELSSEYQPDGKGSYDKAMEMMEIAFTKGAHRFEWDHKRKNGEVFPVEVSLTAIPLDGERVLHTVWRDVTERKQAEEALRESEEHFRRVVEDQTEFIVRWLPDGTRTWVNESYCRYFNETRERILGSNFQPLIHEEDREFVSNRIAALTLEKPVSTGEHRVILPDGSIAWNEWTDRAIFDKDKRLIEYQSIGRDITDRKQAEEALLKSEEEYRSTLKDLLVGVIVHASDTSILLSNPEATNILGLTSDQLSGKKAIDPAWHFLYEDATAMKVEDYPVNKVLAAKKPLHDYVLGVIRPDRDYLTWVNVNAVPVFNKDNKIEKIVINFEDITDRKQAEEALAEERNRANNILKGTNAGTWDWNIQTGELAINERWAEIIGYTLQELGHIDVNTWIKYIHPDDLPRANDMLDKHFKGELDYYDTVFRQPHKDGSWIWVNARGKVVEWSDDGKPLRMSGTHLDITERRQAENEIRRLRNYLKNIVDSMPSILIGVDTQGHVTQWNHEAQRVTGIPVEKAQGRTLEDVFPHMAGEMEKVRQAIQEGRTIKDSKIAHRQDSETKFTDVTIYPLVANGVEGAVIRIDDVTERVRIEEMMIQSEKMLSVGGLAAGMAHEINNPLAGILQNIQVLQNRFSPEMQKNQDTARECGTTIEAIGKYMNKRNMFTMFDAINESGKRAAAIVENMLSFSRKGDPRISSHDIPKLLDRTIELAANDYDLKKKFDFRHIDIVREYDPSTPLVPCESSKIQQVILNLLRNGAQAMAEQEDRTESLRFILRTRLDGDMARIEVEDNGPGMTADIRKRIFEPFFTTKNSDAGTGLGLSVSYFIITENHGGTMTVESAPGRGARFIIRLPLTKKN